MDSGLARSECIQLGWKEPVFVVGLSLRTSRIWCWFAFVLCLFFPFLCEIFSSCSRYIRYQYGFRAEQQRILWLARFRRPNANLFLGEPVVLTLSMLRNPVLQTQWHFLSYFTRWSDFVGTTKLVVILAFSLRLKGKVWGIWHERKRHLPGFQEKPPNSSKFAPSWG